MATDIVKQPLIGSDLILLLLAAPSRDLSTTDRINGITRLEKLLFLADKETKISGQVEEAFKFHAYDYGPYSKEIYEAVDLLEEMGLLREERVFEGTSLDEQEELATAVSDQEGVERRFFLTEDGKAIAGLLAKEHQPIAGELEQVKRKYGSMPLRQLIEYVYSEYEDMAERSKIRYRVRGTRT